MCKKMVSFFFFKEKYEFEYTGEDIQCNFDICVEFYFVWRYFFSEFED